MIDKHALYANPYTPYLTMVELQAVPNLTMMKMVVTRVRRISQNQRKT